jgi:hypothetical protein
MEEPKLEEPLSMEEPKLEEQSLMAVRTSVL